MVACISVNMLRPLRARVAGASSRAAPWPCPSCRARHRIRVAHALPPAGEPGTESSATSSSPQQQQPASPGAAAAGSSGSEEGPIWTVPWDFFEATRTFGLLWVANQAIPALVISLAAKAQGLEMAGLPAGQQELLSLAAQVLQLGATIAILRASTAPHRPLPPPWFKYSLSDSYGVMLAGAAAVAAAGGGVLAVAALSQGQANGVGEWQQMLSEEAAPSGALLALSAVVLAPASEELMFRGYLLPTLTKWMGPAAAVGVSALFFAAAHPPAAFLPELLLGAVLGTACVAARGNLVAPTLAHAAYNGLIVAAAVLLRGVDVSGGGGMQ